MKRAHQLRSLLEFGVELVGLFESFWIKCDDGVDHRTVFVKGIDPIQVHLRQLMSR